MSWKNVSCFFLKPFIEERKKKDVWKKWKVKIEDDVSISSTVDTIGEYSFIGRNTELGPNVRKIGKFCNIGSDCLIGPNIHPLDWVSTATIFYSRPPEVSSEKERIKKYQENKIRINDKNTIIGNDVWIGSKVIILPGLQIGDGSIVGAGSVVTKDVEPYSIVAGNPAKQIRKRLSDPQIKQLLSLDIYNKIDSESLVILLNRLYGSDITTTLNEISTYIDELRR